MKIELNRDWTEFLSALIFHRVRFLLIGGHAVAGHAEPRLTEDLDVFVEPTLRNAQKLRDALVDFGFGECKNWSSRVGRPELDTFRAKFSRRFGRCRLGFFVATGGFTEPFLDMVTRYGLAPDGIVVVPIGPEDLARLVHASDRNAELRSLHGRTIFAEPPGTAA